MATEGERTLEYTPAWALATASTVFIVISLIVERSLHAFAHYLHRTKRKSLNLALQKMKDELMLVGFISLAITIFSTPLSKLCVRSSLYDKWTPCDISTMPNATSTYPPPVEGRRRLLAAPATSYCKEGYVTFVSYNTLHQLHIFIFVLAGVHVIYTCLTTVLALTKVYSWGKWEREAHQAIAQHTSEDFARQSTFVRYHASKPLGVKFFVWVVCFFKQFHVPRADYLTLRLSFVTTHNLRENYNFHDYIIRCMEDEFETIVGISLWQWGFVIVYLLFSVLEPYAHFWVAMVPPAVVLIIGTKLQYVIATLALEHPGVTGPFVGLLLEPRDQLFWFNRPRFLLHVIHFIFFESAFELAMFIWHVWQFSFKTCLLEDNKTNLYIRLSLGVATQILCSFSTFPLFELVSQMSTIPKKAFLSKTVERGLRKWHEDAKRRLKVKVMEEYQMQRLAKRHSRGALKPLDERYFLQDSSDSLFDISDDRRPGRSGPMTRIKEEGGLPIPKTSDPTTAATGEGSSHNHDQVALLIKASPRVQANDNIRRRISPRPGMNLHIPPFQQPEAQLSPPIKPIQRSWSTAQ